MRQKITIIQLSYLDRQPMVNDAQIESADDDKHMTVTDVSRHTVNAYMDHLFKELNLKDSKDTDDEEYGRAPIEVLSKVRGY